MNKTADILLKAFQEVVNITNEFMKYAEEEERKEKERKSKQPPKVYFQRDAPYPQPQTNLTDKNKNHINKNHDKITHLPLNAKTTDIQHKIKNAYEKYLNPLQQKIVKVPTKQSVKHNNEGKQQRESDQLNNKKKASHKEQIPQKKRHQRPPEKPKAPISAFLRFNKAHMEQVKKNYPHMNQSDLVSVTGHMWSQSPPDVKKKYQEEYARDKERYDASMIEYNRKYPQQKSRKQILLEKTLNLNNP